MEALRYVVRSVKVGAVGNFFFQPSNYSMFFRKTEPAVTPELLEQEFFPLGF